MLYFCPFSMKAFCSFTVSCIGFFGRIKKPKIISDSLVLYAREKFLRSRREAHSFVACFVVFLRTSISMVLRRSRLTQVIPSVVRLIFVNMVNFVFGPFSCHPKPDDAVHHVFLSPNSYFYASAGLLKTGYFSYGSSYRKFNFPAQFSSVSVIAKKLSDLLRGKISVCVFMCHVSMIPPEDVIVKGHV